MATEHRTERDVVSPELALIDPELARTERAQPIVTRLFDRRKRGRDADTPASGRSLLAFDEEALDSRREELRSELRAFAEEIRARTIDPEPEPTRAAAVRSALTHALRRRGDARRIIFVLALPLLVAAGVLLLVGTHWFHVGNQRSSSGTPAARTHNAKVPAVAHLTALRPHAFAWAAASRATYYRVRFFRGDEQVFEAKPSQPRILVPSRWTFHAHPQTLAAGTYHWVVQPGFGRRSENRYGRTVVDANWVASP